MMTVTMSEDKKHVAEPTFALADHQVLAAIQPIKSRLSKKHIVIAVVSLLITGLIVTAVLVGIRMFTESNMEIAKYTLQANGVSQNVSINNNAVSFHVIKNGVEAWIVQDFDREIQVTKVLSDGHTMCYVTALNRSMASDAASIPDVAPELDSKTPTGSMLYQVVDQPIADISFLGKKASTMCQNIPTYHAIPDCGKTESNAGLVVNNATSADHRSKRTPRFCATCNLPSCRCACGCCSLVCARFASTNYVCYYSGGNWWCTYYIYGSPYAVYTLRPSCTFGGYYYWP